MLHKGGRTATYCSPVGSQLVPLFSMCVALSNEPYLGDAVTVGLSALQRAAATCEATNWVTWCGC